MLGAVDLGGPWRVYPLSRQARNQLLLEGACLRGHRLQLHYQNPFILQGPGETKRREVVLVPQASPEEIMSREVELGCESWSFFASSCYSTTAQRTLSLWLCPYWNSNERLRANCLPWRRAVALGVLGTFYLFCLLALQQHDVTIFELSIVFFFFFFSAAIWISGKYGFVSFVRSAGNEVRKSMDVKKTLLRPCETK